MATRDFIKIDRTTTTAVYAGDLLVAITSVRSAINQLDKVKQIMEHNHDGTVFTDLEALFGLPAGKGTIVYDYVNGTRGALSGTFQNNNAELLIARVG